MSRYDLGLSTEEFGDLTYAMFDALVERKKMEERKEYLRMGTLAAAIINTSWARPEQPAEPEKFLPAYLQEEESDLSTLAPEDTAARMINMFSKRTFTRK